MSARQPVPAGFVVSGPDVSSYNAPINWSTVAAGGSTFALVKASEGDYYVNPYYSSDVAAAKAQGLIVGPYVWPRPDYSNPIAQADYFLQAANYRPDAQSLPPMVDLEWGTAVGSTACYGLTPAEMSSWIRQFVTRLQQVTRRDPIIYTNTNWWNPCTGNDTSFGYLPLDIAVWGSNPQPLPAGWSDYTFWQYTDNAAIDGAGVVDGDVFKGTPGGLVAFASGVNHPPVGSVDSVTAANGAITVRGWTLDPDTTASIPADLYIDGVGTRLNANESRPDIAATYPGEGDLHGFTGTVSVPPGEHTVCVFGIDSINGPNTLINCQKINTNHPPIGSVDSAQFSGPNSITVQGWVLDPDTTASIPADVYIDGVGTRLSSTGDRPDVATAYGMGSLHGFTGTIGVSAGTHQVCVFGIDSVDGPNTLLNCQSVTNYTPVGSVDAVTATSGAITVRGWALDPNTSASIPADVYIDGAGTRLQADQSRPDVAAAYPGEGDLHGFTGTINAAPGNHQVCVFSIDSVNGPNTLLNCRNITVTNHPPVGSVDVVTAASGAITVRGWALDPDTSASIPADVYIDGAGTRLQADQSRPDVAAAYPGEGDLHGFTGTINAAPGNHQVCVFSIDSVNGPNTLLNCRNVTV